ncbi:UNVERIFIED_ORG: hypothetical protein FHR63_000718 [Xanthomonas campestris]
MRIDRVRIQRSAADDVAAGITCGIDTGLPALVDAVVEVQAVDRGLAVVGGYVIAPVVGEVAFGTEHHAIGLALDVLAATAGIDVEAVHQDLRGTARIHQRTEFRADIRILAAYAQRTVEGRLAEEFRIGLAVLAFEEQAMVLADLEVDHGIDALAIEAGLQVGDRIQINEIAVHAGGVADHRTVVAVAAEAAVLVEQVAVAIAGRVAEIEGTQVEGAAVGRGMIAARAAEHVLRIALARRLARIEPRVRNRHQVLAADGTVAATEAVLLAVFARHRDVAAAVRKVGACREAGEGAVVVALIGQAGLRARLESGEGLLEDEVDHAGHCVGAVDGRGTTGDDFDAFHPFHRNRVDVHRSRARAGTHVATAVDQHQGAVHAHAAQVEQAQAGGADEAGGIAQRVARCQRRHARHQVADGGRAGGADFLGTDCGDRRGRDKAGTRNARAGDSNLVQIGGAGCDPVF